MERKQAFGSDRLAGGGVTDPDYQKIMAKLDSLSSDVDRCRSAASDKGHTAIIILLIVLLWFVGATGDKVDKLSDLRSQTPVAEKAK